MTEPDRKIVRVHTPATSANLGPGFDCLGLALELFNISDFSLTGRGVQVVIRGEGSNILPTGTENLVFRAFEEFFQYTGQECPAGVGIQSSNGIPLGSGLGSSSAAVLTGLLGAQAFSPIKLNQGELLSLATRLEGHPDNVAACLLGGLVVVIQNGDEITTRNISPLGEFQLALAIPDIELPTREARAQLPKQISREDAVFNLGRAALVIEALRNSDPELLGKVMDDRLHQPYRLGLIPGAKLAIEKARFTGAAAAALSGAGPGVIAFCRRNTTLIAQAMVEAFVEAGVVARPLITSIDLRGAWVETIPGISY